MSAITDSAQGWANDVTAKARGLRQGTELGIVRETRLIGGAMITMLIIAVVLNEVFGAVNVGSGPFSQVGQDLQTTGVAAIGLLVVGLIIVAANALMSRFGGM